MQDKVIIINIKDGSKESLGELQQDLFNNGYKWAQTNKEIRNFYSFSSESIIIIDKLMYIMSDDNIQYLLDVENLQLIHISNVTTYFRTMKLKKLKKS